VSQGGLKGGGGGLMKVPDRQLKVCALQPCNGGSQFNSQHCFGGTISLSKKCHSHHFATGCI